MEITVVIPNYNGEKFLHNCLEALLIEEGEFEILIIDNGSTDKSKEILMKYNTKSLSMRCIFLDSNYGFCYAVNLGIRESKGKYVILLNNDTMIHPGFVLSLYHAIQKSTKIFSVSSLMVSMHNEKLVDDAGDQYNVLGFAYGRGKGKNIEGYLKPKKVFAACGGASIYRKEVFETIGYFDENHFAYLEDIDIGYRSRIFGYENWYEPTAKVSHYGSGTSGSKYNKFKVELSAENNAYMILKNMPLLQLIWNMPFLVLGCIIKAIFFIRKKMSWLYIKSYCKGIKKYYKDTKKIAKVKFMKENFSNYLYIQILLYRNLLTFFIKS